MPTFPNKKAGHWCGVHQSSSPRVMVRCPYYEHLTHVHRVEVANAKLGWSLVGFCTQCQRQFSVLVKRRLIFFKAIVQS